MDNDTILAEPPSAPPQPPVSESMPKMRGVPPTAKSKFADKFRAELPKAQAAEALERGETPTEPVKVPEPSKPTEPVKPAETPTEPTKPQETPASTKPESPLDVVLESAKKEPEKPTEPDPLAEFDKITVPKSEHWSRARGVMKTQSEKIKELESKITAPKATPEELATIAKERDDLKAALDDRETRLKAAGAEYSPEYQKLVTDHQNIAGKIATRMKSFGGDADLLIEALSMPYGKIRAAQIEEALQTLDTGKQARVQTLIEELEGHDEKITEFRKDLPARYDEFQAKNAQAFQEQQQNLIKQLESEFLKVNEKIPDSTVTLREVPEDVPGGSDWNKEISEARAIALRVLKPDGADFNESAAIALKGARYDSLEKRYLALHKDHVALKKQMAEYDSSGPDFKGGSKPTVKVAKKPGAVYHETLEQIQRGGMVDV